MYTLPECLNAVGKRQIIASVLSAVVFVTARKFPLPVTKTTADAATCTQPEGLMRYKTEV